MVRTLRALEDGKTEIELKSVDFISVVQQAQATFEERLHKKNLELTFNQQELEGVSVLAEPVSLNHSVINNLVSNAIKFSHDGGRIEIKVSADENEVRVAVRDYGVGMPKTLLEKVFMPNESTSRTGTSGESGTGFGMPLVKSYMERYGGAIKIQSSTEGEGAADHGTTVTLCFKTSNTKRTG